jgi:hypothetical protein
MHGSMHIFVPLTETSPGKPRNGKSLLSLTGSVSFKAPGGFIMVDQKGIIVI